MNEGWQSGNRQQRLLAALLAAGLTILLGRQLNSAQGHRQQQDLPAQGGTVSYLSMFNVRLPARPAENLADLPATANPANNAAAPPRTNTRPAAPTGVASHSDGAALPAFAADSAADSANQSASEPAGNASSSALNLDSKAIARAYKDGRSELQKMADAAGKTLESQAPTKMQQFDTAMKEAAVPSCLAQGEDPMKHNPPKLGGVSFSGLFALPFYVGAIAKGKCK
ncbi:MAG: hypothetical protein V4634_09725 [Pseudomonadota bacterium]